MSTILDALKKSERERTVLRGLGFSDAGWRPARDIDWPRWAVLGGIAAIAIVAAVVFVLRAGIVSLKSTSAPLPAAAVSPVTPGDVAPPVNTSPALAEVAPTPLQPTPVPIATGKAEFLNTMSPEFQKTVPPMTVNIHVYAPEESGRILYINNRSYRRGDDIPGGIRVEEIIPEGVVLQFQGQRFKLARPS